MPRIEFTIDPEKQTTKVEAFGYQGNGACRKATRPFEDGLGPQAGDRVEKAEACSQVEQSSEINLFA